MPKASRSPPTRLTPLERARDLAAYAWQAHISSDESNAARAFRLALKRAPDDGEVLARYAAWLLDLGRTDEAFVAAKAAVAKLPNTIAAWCTLAEVARAAGDRRAAKAAAERCCKLDPKLATAQGKRARKLIIALTA